MYFFLESENNIAFLEKPISKKIFNLKFIHSLSITDDYMHVTTCTLYSISLSLSIARHTFFDIFNRLSNKKPIA